ncbi:MAG: insulinase family protein [Alphaproteobacteria bacterium]|nr:insulinase family protein [Alphaproteobacteria bacterium]
MAFKNLLLIFLVLNLSACFGTPEKPTIQTNPSVLTKTLNNGFSYHLFEAKNDQDDAKVSFRFMVDIGSFQEDASQKGYAHFVEHLAFRGSKNFTYEQKKQHLSDGGLNFGQHSNAFTDYDKTLYFIDEINATEARLTTDLKLFRDVAGGILFADIDVNLERGIVIQELLLRQQKANNIQQKIAKLYDATGVFEDKDPIGTRQIIELANPKQLKAFYHKWYQPQFMHLMVAGNFDKQKMATQIEAIFNDLPKSERTKPQNPQPNLPTGAHFIDNDQYPNNEVHLYIPIDDIDYALKTTDQFQQVIFNDFVVGGIDSQLHRINDAAGKQFPLLKVSLTWRHNKPFVIVTVRHAPNQRIAALEFITQNFTKLREQGFDKSQFDNQIDYIDVRAKNPTSPYGVKGSAVGIANQLYSDVAYGVQHTSQKQQADQARYFISQANQDNVKIHIQKLLNQQLGMLVLTPIPVTNDEQKKLTILLDEFNQDQAVALSPSDSKPRKVDEIAQYDGESGSIVEQNIIEGSAIKYLKLSNSMNVFLQQRSDDSGHISIKLMAKGGVEFLPANLVPASKIALQILSTNGIGGLGQQQLLEYLNKNGLGMWPYIELVRHGIKMNVQKKPDQEKAFNLLHQALIRPVVHEGQFTAAKQAFITQLEQFLGSPQGRYFVNSVKGIYTEGGDHLMVNVEVAKTMTSGDVLAVYDHLFTDMSRWNLIIVGDFNENIIENYLKKYIASLPTKSVELKQAIVKTTKLDFELRSKEAEKDQSTVELSFMNEGFDKKLTNRNAIFIASAIIKKRLFEELRTKQGLVYGVNAGLIIQKLSVNPATLKINFSALPQNEQQSISIIQQVLSEVKANGFSSQEFKTGIAEAKEALRKFNDSNEGIAHSIAKNVINDELFEGYINADKNLAELNLETLNRMFNQFMQNSVKTKSIFSNQ